MAAAVSLDISRQGNWKMEKLAARAFSNIW